MKVGDLVGWGMLIPTSQMEKEDRMVICYLTINRNIALTRVLFEPPGGLYPIVVLPTDGAYLLWNFFNMLCIKCNNL